MAPIVNAMAITNFEFQLDYTFYFRQYCSIGQIQSHPTNLLIAAKAGIQRKLYAHMNYFIKNIDQRSDQN